MDESTPDRIKAAQHDERALIGEILRNPSEIAQVASAISPDDLIDFGHQAAYRAILALWEARSPIGLDTVFLQLVRDGREKDFTANDLADCWMRWGGVGMWIPRLVKQIKCRASLRDLEQTAIVVLDRARRTLVYEGDEAESVLGEAYGMLNRCMDQTRGGGPRLLSDAVHEAFDRIDRRSRGEDKGRPTGFADLDELFCGFRPGELVTVGARPSVGKTAIALALCLGLTRAGAVALFASLEQPAVDLAERSLAMDGRVYADALRRGALTPTQISQASLSGERLAKLRLWIDDGPRQDLARLSATGERVKAIEGRLDLFVVDYLQLLASTPGGERKATRQEQVAEISSGLKRLARTLNCCVLALAQLNREVEHRSGSPRLADLRDSGQIEQDSDAVILLHRGERPPPGEPHRLQVILAKQRNGPVGECTLEMDPDTYAFGDAVRPGF